MKRTLFYIVILLFTVNITAQKGSIKIFTTIDSAEFKIKFNGVLENKIPITTIKFDSLEINKYHKVVITFNADTIADIEREIYLFEGENREYEILKKATSRRRLANMRRKAGKFLKLGGNHDKDEELYEIYYLTRNDEKLKFNKKDKDKNE